VSYCPFPIVRRFRPRSPTLATTTPVRPPLRPPISDRSQYPIVYSKNRNANTPRYVPKPERFTRRVVENIASNRFSGDGRATKLSNFRRAELGKYFRFNGKMSRSRKCRLLGPASDRSRRPKAIVFRKRVTIPGKLTGRAKRRIFVGHSFIFSTLATYVTCNMWVIVVVFVVADEDFSNSAFIVAYETRKFLDEILQRRPTKLVGPFLGSVTDGSGRVVTTIQSAK